MEMELLEAGGLQEEGGSLLLARNLTDFPNI